MRSTLFAVFTLLFAVSTSTAERTITYINRGYAFAYATVSYDLNGETNFIQGKTLQGDLIGKLRIPDKATNVNLTLVVEVLNDFKTKFLPVPIFSTVFPKAITKCYRIYGINKNPDYVELKPSESICNYGGDRD
ncbi:hypothetical protein U1Q18_046933 [Sarracenia purpurea var. burkii]